MKKILAILFSLFYFGFSSGAVFSTHYCMEELTSISIQADDICSKCGIQEKKGCCKTEINIVKIDDSQKSDLLKIDSFNQVSDVPKHEFYSLNRAFSRLEHTYVQSNVPPENRSVPIFIYHCNFRI